MSTALQQVFVFRFPGLSPGRVWRHLVRDEPLKKVYAPMRLDRYRPADYTRTNLPRLKKAREKRSLQLALSTISLPPEAFRERIGLLRQWVGKIQQRGGQVVFVRMPSTNVIREIEAAAWPRHRYWDVFATRMDGLTVHYEDYATLVGLPSPDGSHLDVGGATLFTEALVEIIRKKNVLPEREIP